MCKCGCNSCETESTALVLKESKFVHTPISEGLKYHIDNKIPLSENIYRIGSKEYMKLYSEARSLYSRGKLDVSEDDKYFLTETHVGSFGMFEGKRVPLDIPMLEENESTDTKDILNKNREQIELDFGPRTFRMLQIQLMKDDEAFVKNWFVTNGYMEEEKLPFEENLKKIIKEKLCKKGEAYRKRRMAAGEKSSAYLSGRAVKVCKGQMSGKKKKKTNENTAPNHDGKAAPYGSGYKVLNIDEIAESLRDWFKKENWVRINTSGNISGDCGTMKKDKATTRCLPKKKAQSLTKAERKATVAKKVRGSKKGKQFVSVDEAYSGFIRNPEDPDFEPFNPTGIVSEFREELRALFGKFKGDLKNPEFIKGVAQIMNNWKSLLRSQLNENFDIGDRVELKPDYEETPGEIFIITQTSSGGRYFIADEDGRGWYAFAYQLAMADDEYINEAKKKKKKEKKDPPIGKPKRGGSKAYYVYVRDPKTKKVKKVSFGSGGLRAKIRNPKARKAFAARHNCKNKKDRTKAGYWSCNLPRYAPQLGLGAKMNTFW